MKRLRGAFLQELSDHVEALNRDLLALEKADADDAGLRGEIFVTLFRSAHTLKGASRTAGVSPIETASHHLESILSRFRDTGAQPDEETFGILFAAIDAIEEAGKILQTKGDLAASPIEKILPDLELCAAGRGSESRFESEIVRREVSPGKMIEKAVPKKPRKKRVSSVPASLLARQAKAAPAAAPAPAPCPVDNHSAETVRVPASKLDTMLASSGQLLSVCEELSEHQKSLRNLRLCVEEWKREWAHTRGRMPSSERATHQNGTSDRLEDVEMQIRELSKAFGKTGAQLARSARDMDGEVHGFRLFPFSDGCAALDRAVRDLASAAGKDIELKLSGGETELDRTVLESLKGPLLHLVRNAVDHGIELPAERRAEGKAARAVIHVRAELRGDRIEVVVEDDGRGIDEANVRAARAESVATEVATASNLLEILAEPGFSTAPMITEVSGRGVGLDAAKNGIESIGGRMELASTPGTGTRFTLTVPLTITTLRVVLVKAGSQVFGLPTLAVERMIRLERSAIRSLEGRELVSVDGEPVPVWALQALLGQEESLDDASAAGKVSVLILSAPGGKVALAVDEFVDTRKVVVKKLGRRVGDLPLTSGVTFLAGGRIALILNTAGLIRQTRIRQQGHLLGRTSTASDEERKKRVLYSEDSPTTRSLVGNILTSCGYEVLSTVDGAAGWERLQQEGADIVVSDVDMPRMNGFELTAAIRSSPRFNALPVILITARETEQDKIRGMEAGANAYIMKGNFDQSSLLESLDLLLS